MADWETLYRNETKVLNEKIRELQMKITEHKKLMMSCATELKKDMNRATRWWTDCVDRVLLEDIVLNLRIGGSDE